MVTTDGTSWQTLQPLDPLDSQVSGVTSLVDDYHVGEKEGGLHPDNPALLAKQATSLLVHSSPEIKQVGLHLGFQPGYTLLLAFHLLNFSLRGRCGDRRTLCYFSKFKYADISKETELVIQLSKILFKKCDIKIRVLSESTQIGSDFIGFAYNGKNYKEIFQLL